jgi:hypothetical protein
MSDARVTVVQLKPGARRHGVLAAGDSTGTTLCRRKFRGALILPDADVDCKACLRRGWAP